MKLAVAYSLISIMPILFLDTSILISVLIPITMVAGTAWFSISLANMKQKFEAFGLELTVNLFEAFSISLGLLFMLSLFSLSSFLWQDIVAVLPLQNVFKFIAFVIGTLTVGDVF